MRSKKFNKFSMSLLLTYISKFYKKLWEILYLIDEWLRFDKLLYTLKSTIVKDLDIWKRMWICLRSNEYFIPLSWFNVTEEHSTKTISNPTHANQVQSLKWFPVHNVNFNRSCVFLPFTKCWFCDRESQNFSQFISVDEVGNNM